MYMYMYTSLHMHVHVVPSTLYMYMYMYMFLTCFCWHQGWWRPPWPLCLRAFPSWWVVHTYMYSRFVVMLIPEAKPCATCYAILCVCYTCAPSLGCDWGTSSFLWEASFNVGCPHLCPSTPVSPPQPQLARGHPLAGLPRVPPLLPRWTELNCQCIQVGHEGHFPPGMLLPELA